VYKWDEVCAVCEKLLDSPSINVNIGVLYGALSARSLADSHLPYAIVWAGPDKHIIEKIQKEIIDLASKTAGTALKGAAI
jgi:hypothetical protein